MCHDRRCNEIQSSLALTTAKMQQSQRFLICRLSFQTAGVGTPLRCCIKAASRVPTKGRCRHSSDRRMRDATTSGRMFARLWWPSAKQSAQRRCTAQSKQHTKQELRVRGTHRQSHSDHGGTPAKIVRSTRARSVDSHQASHLTFHLHTSLHRAQTTLSDHQTDKLRIECGHGHSTGEHHRPAEALPVPSSATCQSLQQQARGRAAAVQATRQQAQGAAHVRHALQSTGDGGRRR